jgi:DNA-binding NarL/FixJ family response regulator
MKTAAVVRIVSLCTGPSRTNAGVKRAPTPNTREFPADGVRKPRLTAREVEVLALLCEGLSNKLICRRLNICTGTVKCHVASILDTLGVASRLQAVVAAHRLGLICTLPTSRGAQLVASRIGAAA